MEVSLLPIFTGVVGLNEMMNSETQYFSKPIGLHPSVHKTVK